MQEEELLCPPLLSDGQYLRAGGLDTPSLKLLLLFVTSLMLEGTTGDIKNDGGVGWHDKYLLYSKHGISTGKGWKYIFNTSNCL